MWNRDLKLKLCLICFTAGAGIVLMARHGMRFEIQSASHAIGTVCLLLPFAILFNGRKLDQFANLLTGFLCMVVFNFFLSILTYAGTPLNAPLADDWLANMDSLMGVHVPSVVAWSRSHPWIYRFFDQAYYSVLLSTLLALVVLGFDNDVRRLQDFVLHFILGGLITTLIFFIMPAEAPEGYFSFEPTEAQQRFLDHFYALRAGEFRVISMNNLEGLITYPSFHTTWAILVAYAFRPYRWLFAPMVLLNAAVVGATVILGWHYAIDAVGGILVAATAISLARWSANWRYAMDVPQPMLPAAV